MNYAEIEWLTPDWLFTIYEKRVGILRVWNRNMVPGIKNKNPYAWVCTVVHTSKEELEFKGVMCAPTLFHYRNIIAELQRYGYTDGFWMRYDPATKRERKIRFSPSKSYK